MHLPCVVHMYTKVGSSNLLGVQLVSSPEKITVDQTDVHLCRGGNHDGPLLRGGMGVGGGGGGGGGGEREKGRRGEEGHSFYSDAL